jgi:hypothetical protein
MVRTSARIPAIAVRIGFRVSSLNPHTEHRNVNIIFSGSCSLDDTIYDYSGIYTRRSGGTDWKAVVLNADVVCRPTGVIDDGLNEDEILEVIRHLIMQSIEDVVGPPGAR